MPAQASQAPEILRFPVAGEVFVNPCTGETVTVVNGSFQIVLHETFDGSGGAHVIAEGNAHGVQAVSDTGTRYQLPGGFWAEFNTNGDQQTESVVDVFNMISQGTGENFTIETVEHITVNANGDVTAEFSHFADSTCRG